LVRLLALMFLLLTACLLAQDAAQPKPSQAAPVDKGSMAPASDPSLAPMGPAQAGFPLDQFKEFSAIMVGSVQMGDDREGHIYRSGDLLRTEGGEGHGFYVMDLKKYATYGISSLRCMKDNHMYFRAFPFSLSRPDRKMEHVPIGTETVDGHVCKIEHVTVSGGDLPKPIELKFWEAEDLQGFPVKVQLLKGLGKAVIQYKNIALGPQDPTLFIYPRDCGDLPTPEDTPVKRPAARAPKAAPPADNPK
jgi:hypothetical protein